MHGTPWYRRDRGKDSPGYSRFIGLESDAPSPQVSHVPQRGTLSRIFLKAKYIAAITTASTRMVLKPALGVLSLMARVHFAIHVPFMEKTKYGLQALTTARLNDQCPLRLSSASLGSNSTHWGELAQSDLGCAFSPTPRSVSGDPGRRDPETKGDPSRWSPIPKCGAGPRTSNPRPRRCPNRTSSRGGSTPRTG